MYPYDYMDCFEKFDQTELPTKEQLYSVQNDQLLQMGNTTMEEKFGKPSTLTQWVGIMTYTLRVTCFCWLMCSKASERPVCKTTN